MAGPQQAKLPTPRVPGARILIVEARYYDAINDMLLAGAKRAIDAAGGSFDVFTVPGALEIPTAILLALEAAEEDDNPYDGAVALGCVIRGETSHYDIVAGDSARALMDLSVAARLPLGNGILTVDTEAQAIARAALDSGDKGGFAANAALSLIAMQRDLEGE